MQSLEANSHTVATTTCVHFAAAACSKANGGGGGGGGRCVPIAQLWRTKRESSALVCRHGRLKLHVLCFFLRLLQTLASFAVRARRLYYMCQPVAIIIVVHDGL